MLTGNKKQAYNTLKSLRPANRAMLVEDENGKLLMNSVEVLHRWIQYCDGLFN